MAKELNDRYFGRQLPHKFKFGVTDAAIDYFEENANPSERFRATLTRLGVDDLRKRLEQAYQG